MSPLLQTISGGKDSGTSLRAGSSVKKEDQAAWLRVVTRIYKQVPQNFLWGRSLCQASILELQELRAECCYRGVRQKFASQNSREHFHTGRM